MSGGAGSAAPGKTIAVILGAQAWPLMKGLKSSDAFALSATAFKAYLQDKDGLNLPEESVKDLFDEEYSNNKIDEEIDAFLRKHHVEGAPDFNNLIVYFTGHGAFTRRDQYFQMILRSTRESNSDFSGYQMRQLAATVNAAARAVRKVVILDCCYAASAFRDWQMQGEADIKAKIGREAAEQFAAPAPQPGGLRPSGTALICACDDEKWALYKDGLPTMFSGGLLQALREGDPAREPMLGISDLYALTRDHIIRTHHDDAVTPALHVAKGQAETMLTAPLFPNPARRADLTAQKLAALEATVTELRAQLAAQTAARANAGTAAAVTLANPAPPGDVQASAPWETVLPHSGPLANLSGTWIGKGFSVVAAPANQNDQPYKLKLNATHETLTFTPIGYPVPNSGFTRDHISVLGLHYLQQVADAVTNSVLRIERGLWLDFFAINTSAKASTVAQLLVLPQGDTLFAPGSFLNVIGPPRFPTADTMPFRVDPRTGARRNYKNPASPPQQIPGTQSPPWIPKDAAENPNLVLMDALKEQIIVETAIVILDAALPDRAASAPEAPFIAAKADANSYSAIFWIETIRNSDNTEFFQLQYSQTLVREFNGLRWPHISVGTLIRQ